MGIPPGQDQVDYRLGEEDKDLVLVYQDSLKAEPHYVNL